MSIQRHLGYPNTSLGLTEALSFVPGKVEYINDPTGSGRVQGQFPGVGGDTLSNWIQIASTSAGSDNASNKHSGLWNPAQPGQYIFGFYPGGNKLKMVAMAAHVTLSQPGDAG